MEVFQRLYQTIAILRGENGCPWDIEQNIQSMRPHLIEETYEVVDAIDKDDTHDLQEELGDLIFLGVFISYIAEQDGRFTVSDVIQTVTDKLIRRHPHVFSDTSVSGVSDVLKNWESIKLSEKKNLDRKTPFDGIARSLPEIERFRKTLQKLTREGVNIREYFQPDWKASSHQLEAEFNRDNLKSVLRNLFMECAIQEYDTHALLTEVTREIQEEYLERQGLVSKS